MKAILLCALGPGLLGCQGEPQFVTVGRVDGHAAAGMTASPDGGASGVLTAHVDSDPASSGDILHLSCPDTCIELRASASGGNPPYQFSWDDGSTDKTRRVCPSSNTDYTLTVTDTGLNTSEFKRAAQHSSARLHVEAQACDVPAADGSSACTLSNGAHLPSEATGDVVGNPNDLPPLQVPPVVYFAGGVPLPAGRYRVAYVDGCFSCCVTLLDTFWLVGADNTQRIMALPGGSAESVTSVAPVASCPVSVTPIAPIDFDHSGGPLGVWLSDTVSADNVNGDGQGGHSPTWRLSRLDPCPR